MRGFRIEDTKYENSRILCIQVRIRRTNLDITMAKRKREKKTNIGQNETIQKQQNFFLKF